MMLSAVDLPEPEVPVMATSSPRPMSRSTEQRAITSESPARYVRVAPSRRTSGVVDDMPLSSFEGADRFQLSAPVPRIAGRSHQISNLIHRSSRILATPSLGK